MTEAEVQQQQELEPQLNTLEEDNTGILPSYAEEAPASYAGVVASSGALESSYDARTENIITPVREQGSYNTCWAFSAISMAETSMIKNQIAVNGVMPTIANTDLSEWQLAYFTYHHGVDEYGNTSGDATNILYSDALWLGGNNSFTTFALANWTGVAEEATAPYESAGTTPTLDDSLEYADVAHLQQFYWIRFSDQEGVKAAIRECGSVSVNYYHSANYLNYDTGAYYYGGGSSSVNHTITLIGWDDNYAVENFTEESRPQNKGAWLVKNSWGDDWLASSAGNDGGYYWISYEDTNLTKASAKGFAYRFEGADNYDHNYQYDGTTGAFVSTATGDTEYRVNSGNSLADIYTVPEDTVTGGETLKEIGRASCRERV